MRTRLARVLATLATFAALAPAPPAAAATLHIGVLTPEGAFDALRSWDFMAPHLREALPDDEVQLVGLNHQQLRNAIELRQVDFFVANGGFYVEMEAAYGASPLATLESPRSPSPTRAHGATFVVRADRGELRGLRDLSGRRLAVVHELAFAGYQLPLYALRRVGVERDELGGLEFTGLPAERLLEALRDGRVDAVAMRSCLLEHLTEAHGFPAAEFRVLEPVRHPGFGCQVSTDLYPDWPFARLAHVEPAVAKRVARALLAMPPHADGHAWTVPTSYASVHAVFRDLQMGPYAYLAEPSMADLFARYREWAVLVAIAMLGALVHVVRVETIVLRKTRALGAALEERDRIAEAARAREQQFDHLSRLGVLGEMSSMIAHELNQPLAAIGNFARGITRRLQAGRTDPAPLIEASEEIDRQTERAAGIMQRIRGFARKRPADRVECDLREVVDGAIDLFHGMLPSAPTVARAYDLPCQQGLRVAVDRLEIEQLLLNLLKNAYDAVLPLPPRERRILLRCGHAGSHVRIEVGDNGEGLGAPELARLFEPFFTTKHDGLGLGLAICKTVVEAHGGRIGARANAPGPGLTFEILLPLPTANSDA